MFARYSIATALGVSVTFLLFLFMRAMIALGGSGLDERDTVRLPDFVRVPSESSLHTKERELPDKEKPPEEPPPPEISAPESDVTSANAIKISAPPVDTGLDLKGGPMLVAAAADTDIVPLVRVEPMYPRSAMQRGVEGYVTVEFTISANGTVKDAKAVDADPKGVFNQAALAAVRKWKYNPKIENGQAVDRPGVVVTLEFKIHESGQ